MPDFRRYFVPGGTYFFTVVTHDRKRILTSPTARTLLREAFEGCRAEMPFEVMAIVLLPEHLHAIWTLPVGDSNYAVRWNRIKARFTRAWLRTGAAEGAVTAAQQAQRHRGVWQPRYWEHTIRDEGDLERHLDYIHFNPVKHGLVRCPSEWRWCSFHRWVGMGQYPPNWACSSSPEQQPKFDSIATTVGE